ncbi:unnamed protein product [Allacma fusca]|uniref:Uncharacterized protein n=1 Tax=Allacma fusca TaxID=39272 RepID=A0A8J2L234_9HEXA|nr:unnamed protein product [Allacma fusca]
MFFDQAGSQHHVHVSPPDLELRRAQGHSRQPTVTKSSGHGLSSIISMHYRAAHYDASPNVGALDGIRNFRFLSSSFGTERCEKVSPTLFPSFPAGC